MEVVEGGTQGLDRNIMQYLKGTFLIDINRKWVWQCRDGLLHRTIGAQKCHMKTMLAECTLILVENKNIDTFSESIIEPIGACKRGHLDLFDSWCDVWWRGWDGFSSSDGFNYRLWKGIYFLILNTFFSSSNLTGPCPSYIGTCSW